MTEKRPGTRQRDRVQGDSAPLRPAGREEGRTVSQRVDTPPSSQSSANDIQAFLNRAATISPGPGQGDGRLLFALDATMSRQPTWDTACHLQAQMFEEVAGIGTLDVQLIYFRGIGECRASKWVRDARSLASLMNRITCQGGHTQIRRILQHAISGTREKKISALVYVGDCMEENADDLCMLAGELGMRNVPAFMFQEGHEPVAEATFREIARLTKGAFCRFDTGSARQLGELLRAVAVYAAGGRKALIAYRDKGEAGGRKLLEQMR